jgi:hypothetical protein
VTISVAGARSAGSTRAPRERSVRPSLTVSKSSSLHEDPWCVAAAAIILAGVNGDCFAFALTLLITYLLACCLVNRYRNSVRPSYPSDSS